jgi:DNA-binding MarR family transcriptional regulator
MELFLLGRKLMQVAEGALPRSQGATSARLVLIDVVYHQGSSITEITERTGFPQSLVSMAVAKLRELGMLESEPDPMDRRRTLVRTTPALKAIPNRLGQVSIEDIVAKELDLDDQSRVTEVIEALDLVARLIIPEVLAVATRATRTPRRAGS